MLEEREENEENEVEVENEENEEEVKEEVKEEVSDDGDDDGGDVLIDEEQKSDEEVEDDVDDWSPDYTFSALGKKYEIDEFMRPVLNKKNYDQVVELYQKAYGLDHLKGKYNTVKEELPDLRKAQEQLQKQNYALGSMGSLIKNKNYNALFSELKIPDEDIIKYSLDRVQYQDLTPEQKSEYDNNVDSRNRLVKLERENQQFKQSLQQQVVERRNSELDSNLASPDMEGIVSEYDSRVGEPGAFRSEVIRRGQSAYHLTGKDISAQDAIGEVLKVIGIDRQVSSNQANAAVNGNVYKREKNTFVRNKPVIPNVRSGGSSPARKLPRSIDDIKKAVENFEN